MASHESFYTTGAISSSQTASPTSSAPPPPPPKPNTQPQSAGPSRSGTPLPATGLPLPPHPGIPVPLPPSLSNLNLSTTPSTNPISSPRPLPPIPPTPQTPIGTHTPKQSVSGTSTPALPPQVPHTPQQYSQLQQQEPVKPQIPPPSFEEQWLPPDLSSKPISELTPILANPQLLAALASQHPSYASSLEPVKAAIAANLALARQVAQVEAQLTQQRDQTAQLLLNHTSLQTQWRRKQSEMDDALSPWGPRAMYQRLVSSIGEQEALLRAMQESFLDGTSGGDAYYGGDGGKASEKEVAEWIRRIREGTTTLERRREMRARWDEGRVGGWR